MTERDIAPAERRAVTLENWDSPPFNRWAFQHLREILPTVAVARAPDAASVLPRDPQALETIAFEGLEGRPKTVGALLAETYTDGFLVLHRGRIVSERYYNGMTERTPHLSQSVGKSLVGAAAGVLIGRGLIDPEAPLVDTVPELKACGYGTATLRHVLDMRSGVRFSEVYTDPASDVFKIDAACGWKPRHDPGWPATVYDLILSLEQDREHGGPFQYRSIETDVLGWVLERAVGKRLAALVSDELWQPLGAEEDASFTVDSEGTAAASGGFNATLRDYGRFGQMMLDQGCFDGRRIVPAEWVLESRRGDPSVFGAPYTETLPEGAYRNQFWIEDAGSDAILARGVFGQLIYVCPEFDLVAVKLSTWPDFQNPAFSIETQRALRAIGAALS